MCHYMHVAWTLLAQHKMKPITQLTLLLQIQKQTLANSDNIFDFLKLKYKNNVRHNLTNSVRN